MCISALGLKGISNPFSYDIEVIDENGNKKSYDPKFVLNLIDSACQDLSDPWKIEQLYSRIEASIFGGVSENEIIKITLKCASFYAKYDPEFVVVSSKLNSKLSSLIKKEKKREHIMTGFQNLLSS